MKRDDGTSRSLVSRRIAHRRWAIASTAAIAALGLALPAPGMGFQLLAAGALIAVAGIPHGALDAVVALRSAHGTSRAALFALGYTALAAATVLAWLASPPAALVVFLAISIAHFGRGDAERSSGKLGWAEVVARGSLPVVLPIALWSEESAVLFAWLTGAPSAAIAGALASWGPKLLAILFGLALFDWMRKAGTSRARWQASETAVLATLFVALPPLLSFAVYFGLWHSARHLLALDQVLHLGRGLQRRELLSRGAPLVALTLAMGAVAYVALARAPIDARAMTQTLFVELAALTVPHMFITLVVDRALIGDPHPTASIPGSLPRQETWS